MYDFSQLFAKFSSLRVGVVGDVMLDTYMWGAVERISPEAPVPVATLQKKDYRIGGAGNVALNVQSLGAAAFVLSVTGDDEEGRQLEQLFSEQGIRTEYLVKSRDRITTNKIRIISRNQQMMRLDNETVEDLRTEDEAKLIQRAEQFIAAEKPQVVILEDYNKGVLTEKVIQCVIALCRKAGVLVAVDPKRKNFFAYWGVDIFKPNLKEVKDALNLLHTDVNPAFLQGIHAALEQRLQQKISFITLSDKGVFYQENGRSAVIPSHLRNIADVSGAGDTAIAVAALVYAATGDVHLMAEVANLAGGLVCEEVGTVAIDKQKLMHECRSVLA